MLLDKMLLRLRKDIKSLTFLIIYCHDSLQYSQIQETSGCLSVASKYILFRPRYLYDDKYLLYMIRSVLLLSSATS